MIKKTGGVTLIVDKGPLAHATRVHGRISDRMHDLHALGLTDSIKMELRFSSFPTPKINNKILGDQEFGLIPVTKTIHFPTSLYEKPPTWESQTMRKILSNRRYLSQS